MTIPQKMSSQQSSPASSMTPYSSTKVQLSESKKYQLSVYLRVKYLKTMLDEARMRNQYANQTFYKIVYGHDNLTQSHELLDSIKSRREQEVLTQKEKNMRLSKSRRDAQERSRSSLARSRQSNYERERQEYLQLKNRLNKQDYEHLSTNYQKRNSIARQEEARRQKYLDYSCAKYQEFEAYRMQDSVEMQQKAYRFDLTRQELEDQERYIYVEIEQVRKQTQDLQYKIDARQRSRSNSMRSSK